MAGNSIVLASASTQFLSATGKTSINQQKFTFAYWARNTTSGSAYSHASFFKDNNNLVEIVTNALNNMFFLADSGGVTQGELETNFTVGADNNWHHYCWAVDTTQATNTNRIQFYYDGVLQSNFLIANYPSQNANLANNFATTYFIGHVYNGKFAEFYYIDGQQLSPTSFTVLSGGTLFAKSYSGTYTGTFDVYLNFSNASNLGADSSGEGNNWTTNNSPTQSADFPPSVTAWQGSSSINGAGSLSALAKLALQAVASFSASGVMTTAVAIQGFTNSEFDASGSLSAPGALGLMASAIFEDSLNTQPTVPTIGVVLPALYADFAVEFIIGPALSAIAVLGLADAIEFDGGGNLNVHAEDFPPGSDFGNFNGAGSLKATATLQIQNSAAFNGTGSLSSVAVIPHFGSAFFTTRTVFFIPIIGEVLVGGLGGLSCEADLLPRVGAFQAMGSLEVDAYRDTFGNCQFGGNGLMAVNAIVRKGRAGITDNVVEFGPGSTGNLVTAGG